MDFVRDDIEDAYRNGYDSYGVIGGGGPGLDWWLNPFSNFFRNEACY